MRKDGEQMANPLFMFKKDAEEGYVPNRKLLAYAAGLAGQNMNYGYISNWLFYFCNNVLKISADKVGYITSISRVWDSFNDPLIGALIDRRRCKSGEKLRPYLIKLPPFIAILSAAMFLNYGLTQSAALVLVLAVYLLWDLVYSVQDVALWGMVAASSPYSLERARVSQWVSIGAGAGSAVVGLFPLAKDLLINSFGMSAATVFAIGGFVFAFGGEMISMFAYCMKEKVQSEKSKESILEAILVLRHNKTLILISLARFLNCVQLCVPWAYFFESQVSYTVGSTVIDSGTAQFLYGLLVGIPGAFTMFAANAFAKKVGGMKKILLIAQTAKILIRGIAFAIGFQTLPRMLCVMLLMSVVSIPESMMDIAHRSLTSDSIDEVELKTGKRTEGISFSMQNFVSKIGSAVGLFLNGKLLSVLNYDQYIPMNKQNPVFMKWQWPMFILGPAVGSVLYMLAIVFVKDDKKRREQIEAQLHERRAKLSEQLAESVSVNK